jgi:hypothetical protein
VNCARVHKNVGQHCSREISPHYPLCWRLLKPQSRSGRGLEVKHLLPQSGIELRFLGPICSLVATSTEASSHNLSKKEIEKTGESSSSRRDKVGIGEKEVSERG